ncbi:MAG: alpha/beta hydrolase-fold protein [Bacteroidota bacterium]
MQRNYRSWWSPSLGRDMELLHFGHAGTPLLVFPSSLGRFYEWEDFKMIAALSPQLEHGQNQVICVDSVDAESFYNKQVHPHVRIKRQQQYEAYIFNEVLPYIRNTGHSFIMVAGASFGGYHAINMACKQPWQFGKVISLSGAYDIRSFMGGFYSDDVYFSNPVDYLANLSDHGQLEALRRMRIILTAGEHDPCIDANVHLSHLFSGKAVPHTLEVQPGAFGHDWPWWRDQIKQHIG